MTQLCETLYLREPCGGVPNNALPVLLYSPGAARRGGRCGGLV